MTREWLSTEEAAEYLTDRGFDIKPNTLARQRCTGRGLPYYKRGKTVRYRVADLDGEIDRSRIEPAMGDAA